MPRSAAAGGGRGRTRRIAGTTPPTKALACPRVGKGSRGGAGVVSFVRAHGAAGCGMAHRGLDRGLCAIGRCAGQGVARGACAVHDGRDAWSYWGGRRRYAPPSIMRGVCPPAAGPARGMCPRRVPVARSPDAAAAGATCRRQLAPSTTTTDASATHALHHVVGSPSDHASLSRPAAAPPAAACHAHHTAPPIAHASGAPHRCHCQAEESRDGGAPVHPATAPSPSTHAPRAPKVREHARGGALANIAAAYGSARGASAGLARRRDGRSPFDRRHAAVDGALRGDGQTDGAAAVAKRGCGGHFLQVPAAR